MYQIYLVTISVFADEEDTPEKIKRDLENLLVGEFSWGHIDIKKAKIVAND